MRSFLIGSQELPLLVLVALVSSSMLVHGFRLRPALSGGSCVVSTQHRSARVSSLWEMQQDLNRHRWSLPEILRIGRSSQACGRRGTVYTKGSTTAPGADRWALRLNLFYSMSRFQTRNIRHGENYSNAISSIRLFSSVVGEDIDRKQRSITSSSAATASVSSAAQSGQISGAAKPKSTAKGKAKAKAKARAKSKPKPKPIPTIPSTAVDTFSSGGNVDKAQSGGVRTTSASITARPISSESSRTSRKRGGGGGGGELTLVIVESPAKARTIQKFLDEETSSALFEEGEGEGRGQVRVIVDSCAGHIRDLEKHVLDAPLDRRKVVQADLRLNVAQLGIDVFDNFHPLYVEMAHKADVIRRLRQLTARADRVLFATDEDREGEAISWHLTQVLQPEVPYKRAVFHEITKSAVLHAFANPRDIDMNLVNAQETRRCVDRLAGFSLSPVLWRNLAQGLSAGRVQSCALRLIVEKERQRWAFRESKYYSLTALFTIPQQNEVLGHSQLDSLVLQAKLVSLDGKKVASDKDFDDSTGKLKVNKPRAKKRGATSKSAAADGKEEEDGNTQNKGESYGNIVVLDKDRADQVMQWLTRSGPSGSASQPEFYVTDVTHRTSSREAPPPFITSSLQIEASRKFRYSPTLTMSVAQKLYEEGFITYMRTDSPMLSSTAITTARKIIMGRFGAEYLKPETSNTKSRDSSGEKASKKADAAPKNAQEAHEAIRPAEKAGTFQAPSATGLVGHALTVYSMIYKRTIASQMSASESLTTSITVQAAEIAPKPGRSAGKRSQFSEALGDSNSGNMQPQEALFRASETLVTFPGYLAILAPPAQISGGTSAVGAGMARGMNSSGTAKGNGKAKGRGKSPTIQAQKEQEKDSESSVHNQSPAAAAAAAVGAGSSSSSSSSVLDILRKGSRLALCTDTSRISKLAGSSTAATATETRGQRSEEGNGEGEEDQDEGELVEIGGNGEFTTSKSSKSSVVVGSKEREGRGGQAAVASAANAVSEYPGLLSVEHTTRPPNRFSSASFIQELESIGVGRPSTYASLFQTLKERNYILTSGQSIVPTATGIVVTQFLENFIPELVDERFTAEMEQYLDSIAHGIGDKGQFLSRFYFGAALAESPERVEALEHTTQKLLTLTRKRKLDPTTVEETARAKQDLLAYSPSSHALLHSKKKKGAVGNEESNNSLTQFEGLLTRINRMFVEHSVDPSLSKVLELPWLEDIGFLQVYKHGMFFTSRMPKIQQIPILHTSNHTPSKTQSEEVFVEDRPKRGRKRIEKESLLSADPPSCLPAAISNNSSDRSSSSGSSDSSRTSGSSKDAINRGLFFMIGDLSTPFGVREYLGVGSDPENDSESDKDSGKVKLAEDENIASAVMSMETSITPTDPAWDSDTYIYGATYRLPDEMIADIRLITRENVLAHVAQSFSTEGQFLGWQPIDAFPDARSDESESQNQPVKSVTATKRTFVPKKLPKTLQRLYQNRLKEELRARDLGVDQVDLLPPPAILRISPFGNYIQCGFDDEPEKKRYFPAPVHIDPRSPTVSEDVQAFVQTLGKNDRGYLPTFLRGGRFGNYLERGIVGDPFWVKRFTIPYFIAKASDADGGVAANSGIGSSNSGSNSRSTQNISGKEQAKAANFTPTLPLQLSIGDRAFVNASAVEEWYKLPHNTCNSSQLLAFMQLPKRIGAHPAPELKGRQILLSASAVGYRLTVVGYPTYATIDPKYCNPHTEFAEVTTDLALQVLPEPSEIARSMGRVLGSWEGSNIVVKYGFYGPYLQWDMDNRSLKKYDPETITLEEAIEILKTPKTDRWGRPIGVAGAVKAAKAKTPDNSKSNSKRKIRASEMKEDRVKKSGVEGAAEKDAEKGRKLEVKLTSKIEKNLSKLGELSSKSPENLVKIEKLREEVRVAQDCLREMEEERQKTLR